MGLDESTSWARRAGLLLEEGRYSDAAVAAGQALSESHDDDSSDGAPEGPDPDALGVARATLTPPSTRRLRGELFALRARAFTNLRQHEHALPDWEEATARAPDNLSYWVGRGSCLYILNRRDDAKKCFERALELDPYDAEAMRGMRACGGSRTMSAVRRD